MASFDAASNICQALRFGTDIRTLQHSLAAVDKTGNFAVAPRVDSLGSSGDHSRHSWLSDTEALGPNSTPKKNTSAVFKHVLGMSLGRACHFNCFCRVSVKLKPLSYIGEEPGVELSHSSFL